MQTKSSPAGILTCSGQYFDFTDPLSYNYDIEVIAHALANQCRFTGHTSEFYSVAQHSVIVSRLVPNEDALAALLHDAAEAFLGDVSTPLKNLLPDYRRLEEHVHTCILLAFNLDPVMPQSVKTADMRALATEMRDLLPDHDPWEGIQGYDPLPHAICPLPPAAAKDIFLNRYLEIINQPPALIP